jgi:hypothetical protein
VHLAVPDHDRHRAGLQDVDLVGAGFLLDQKFRRVRGSVRRGR